MKSKDSRKRMDGLPSKAVNWIAMGLIFLYIGWRSWELYSAAEQFEQLDDFFPIILAAAVWLIGLILLVLRKRGLHRITRPFWSNVPLFVLLLFIVKGIFTMQPNLAWITDYALYILNMHEESVAKLMSLILVAVVASVLIRHFIPDFRNNILCVLAIWFFLGSYMMLIAIEIGRRIGFAPLNAKAFGNMSLLSQTPYFLFMIPVFGFLREMHGQISKKLAVKMQRTGGSVFESQLVFSLSSKYEPVKYRALFSTVTAFTVVALYTILMQDPLCGEYFGWGFAEALPLTRIAWPAVIGGILVFLDRNVHRSSLKETKSLRGRMLGYSLLAFASYVLMCQWLVKSANLYVYMFGVPVLCIIIEQVLESQILKSCMQGERTETANTIWMDYEPLIWIVGVLSLFAVGTMLNFMPRYLILVLVILVLYAALNAILNRKGEKAAHRKEAAQLRLQTAVNNFWGAAFVVLLLAARNPQLLNPELSNYDLLDLYVLNPRIWIAIGLIVLWFIVSGSFYRIANTKVKSKVRGLDVRGRAIDYRTWMNASQIKNGIVLFMAVLLILVFIINEFKIYPVNFYTEAQKPTVTLYYPAEETAQSRYRLVDVSLPYEEAQASCERAGGHLAVVTSQDENNVLSSLLYGSAAKNCYLLGASRDENGYFAWITGEPFDYTNWGVDEPSSDEENLLMIYGAETGSGKYVGDWNDVVYGSESEFYMADNIGYICEWEADAQMPSDEELEAIFGIDTLYKAKEKMAELLYNLHDKMAAGDVNSAIHDAEKASPYIKELYGTDHLIYIPEVTDENGSVITDSRNGTGVGLYQKTDQDGRSIYAVYYGEYKNGLRSGTGTMAVYSNLYNQMDYEYEGSWVADKPNGEGRETVTILAASYDGLGTMRTEGLYVNGQYYGTHTTEWSYMEGADVRRITEECSYSYGLPQGTLTRHGVYADGTSYDLTAHYRDGQPDGTWQMTYKDEDGVSRSFRFVVQDGQIEEGAYQDLVAEHGDKIRVSMNENGFIVAYVVQDETIYCLTYPDIYCLSEPDYTTYGTEFLLK
ncbi:MAG: hypothetical protein IJK56_06950 [Firmicutes bacterium]|nr:hypothetical protein [Bacillota bacterium]